MSGNDSADLVTEPLDSKYLSHLLDNVSGTQDHLAGNDGTPFSPSSLPLNAIWTLQEKNAFFHALTVYSRFRPDLISHEIKTKSVSDVCNYLSILQFAASQQEITVPSSQWRQNLPIAMEVSSEWVAMEEETASNLIAREQEWQHELIAEQRRAKIKSLKSASNTELHGMEPSLRKAELQRIIANVDLRDRQEDYCESLGSLELTAIDAVLREAIDSPSSSQIKTKQPPVPRDSLLQPSPGQEAGVETVQMLPFPATEVADVQNSPNLARQQLNGSEKPSQQSPSARSQSCSPQQGSKALLAGLSPASRRRHQKRLYMRRKRASVSGAAVIDEGLQRLKPGRRKVERLPSPENAGRYVLGLSTLEDRDMEDSWDTASAHRAKGSSVIRKRYPREKRMAVDELQDLGLGADELKRRGLGLLNPEGVAKMLNLWDKLSGDSGQGSRLSIETIRLLDAHVVWFVKNLIYRAVTLREQECALKSETKVWKLSGKPVLAREHIEKAISMENSRELNKEGFFERIIADMDVNIEAEEISENGSGITLPLLHREIYTPLILIPELEDDSEMSDNTNDEELDNELLEEEELDELDMDIEMDHESGLWDKTQKFQNLDPEIEGSIMKTGRRTMYKSKEFIEDSD